MNEANRSSIEARAFMSAMDALVLLCLLHIIHSFVIRFTSPFLSFAELPLRNTPYSHY